MPDGRARATADRCGYKGNAATPAQTQTLGMLVEQGRIGIRHWTGLTPDAAVMRDTLAALFPAT